MDFEYPMRHKHMWYLTQMMTANTNDIKTDINHSGHTCMSLKQMSFCSMVSTRTISLQRATTCFSSYRPSPFSDSASSSSSTWGEKQQAYYWQPDVNQWEDTLWNMTESTDRGESILSTAVFLHLPSSCPNTDSVLPTQEASAAGGSTEAFLCFFAVGQD